MHGAVRFGMTGMVVFRIKGENDLTERLLKRLNHRGHIHCVPASLKGKYVIRYESFFFIFFFGLKCAFFPSMTQIFHESMCIFFIQISFTVTSTHTSNDDLLKDWAEIRKVSTDLLEELNIHITDHRARVHLKGSNRLYNIDVEMHLAPHVPCKNLFVFVFCFNYKNKNNGFNCITQIKKPKPNFSSFSCII